MSGSYLMPLVGITAAATALGTSCASFEYRDPDGAAVEAVVRRYEQAVQEFDFKRADSMLAPGAQWIEDSNPLPANDWPRWWRDAQAAGVRIINHPQHFTTHLHGSFAWVTLNVEVTCIWANAEGRRLCADSFGGAPQDDQGRTVKNYVESEILVKTGSAWQIALGHTSRIT